MEKNNQPSHVKTIKEIMEEECEKGEEITWKPFKDNLRLRSVKTRTATTAKNSIEHTRPDSPMSWNISARLIQKRSPPAKEKKPVKMSLMALLADEDDEDDQRNHGGENNHQDAAAMPCGHSFCVQQRELHENCPHCSSFIMEILDVL